MMYRPLVGIGAIIVMAVACVAVEPSPRGDVPLATILYLNYGYDYWTGECKGGVESTGWERPSERGLTPEAGYYCSGDDKYIDQALREMKKAGISVVILSWNGWGDVAFNGKIEAPDYVAIDRTIDKVFGHLDGMKTAILVEPYYNLRLDLDNVLPEHKQKILDRVWAHYERHPRKAFFWDNKPLLVTFWPSGNHQWSLGDVDDDRFTHRQWGVLDRGADWDMTAIDSSLEMVRFDPGLDEGFYDQAWKKVFDNQESVKMIGVYGWNPWAEMASIEPTVEYGDTLVEKTRWYFNRFDHGEKYRLYSGD